MCLYPRLIRNKKYEANKKNDGKVPVVSDARTLYVTIQCENCMECRKAKARAWQVRLQEEIRTNTNGKFIALTFSNESIKEIIEKFNLHEYKGYELDNKIAKVAVRKFLERWRKQYKKSLRHWLVTELGHEGTENIHLHGIIWTDVSMNEVEKIWKYGFIWKGKRTRVRNGKQGVYKIVNYVSEQTVNYVIKYVHKQDFDHQYYKSKVLTSPGIGKNYINRADAIRNRFNITNTDETYLTRTGKKIILPKYYRDKLYNDAEKEELWLQKMDKRVKWVCGEKATSDREYFNLLKFYRRKNWELGYKGYHIDQDRKEWEEKRRHIMVSKRTQTESL